MESSTSFIMIIIWISRFILVGDLVLLFVDCRMDATSLIEYVTVLLAGHPDLLRGFDKFVPLDYKVSHGQEAGAK
jgi:histone deacetylase complex regulatory component SIN3